MLQSCKIIFLIVCALAAATAARAEMIDNPQFVNWSKFAVGSSATHDSTSSIGGKEVHVTSTNTLLEKSDSKVVIEIASAIDIDGKITNNKIKQNIAAKVDRDKITEEADEDVEAAGKTYKCKVIEVIAGSSPASSKATSKPVEVKIKFWINPEIPGGVVKMETNSRMGKRTTILKSFEVK